MHACIQTMHPMILSTRKEINENVQLYNHETAGFNIQFNLRSTKAKVLELSYTQIKWNYTGYFRINQSAGAEWLKFLVGFYILQQNFCYWPMVSSPAINPPHFICFYKGRHWWTWLWNIRTLHWKITLQPLIIVHVLTIVVQASICKHYHGKKMSPASS